MQGPILPPATLAALGLPEDLSLKAVEFAGYLGINLFGILLIVGSLTIQYWRRPTLPPLPARYPIFPLLSLIACATTFNHFGKFFYNNYLDSGAPTVTAWLGNARLFLDAWSAILATPARWWWNSQIFGATQSWSLLLAVETRRRGIPHAWAYMVVGQLVAVSFGLNLLFCGILLYPVIPSKRNTGGGPLRALVYIAVYATSIGATQWVRVASDQRSFLRALAAQHAALFVPLFVAPPSKGALRWIGRGVAVAAIATQAQAWNDLMAGVTLADLPRTLWDALVNEHHVATSLACEVLVIGVSTGAWVGLGEKGWRWCAMGLEGWSAAMAGWAAMAVGGVGVVCGVFEGEMEGWGKTAV